MTIYRAGTFYLDVKINGWHVLDSTFSPVYVAPTNLYAPSCVPLGIPTTMVAGTEYTFQIQSRDFYGNNMQLTLAEAVSTDYSVFYSNSEQEVAAVITDDSDLGVFKVTTTLTIAGEYDLQILLRGLEVPHSLSNSVTINPTITTSPLTSNFTGNLDFYLTGEKI